MSNHMAPFIKVVVLLVAVTETLSSLMCTGVCRGKKNDSAACSLSKFSEYDLKLLYPPAMDTCGPSKPLEFKGRVLYPPDQLKAVLEYTWRSPDDSSIKDLIGFQITVAFPTRKTVSPTKVFRIRFDNSSTHRDWSYQLSCTYTKPSTDVRVHVVCQSLPICTNNYSTYNLSINISSEELSKVTRHSDINGDLNVETNSVTEKFSREPSSEVERRSPASTIPPESQNKELLTVVAIVVSVAMIIILTGLVWFLRFKVLKTKDFTLNFTREGREPSCGSSTNSRHDNTTSEASDIDLNVPTKIDIEQNNLRQNTRLHIQHYGTNQANEDMNFEVDPIGPCPVHGYISSKATDTPDRVYIPVAAENSHDNRIYSGADTFSRKQILLRDFDRREPQMATAYESDDDNCTYNPTTIEEKWLRLNEEML